MIEREMSGSVYGKMSEAAYGKAKTDKIKMIGEKLKSNIGKKAKVKQQGKGKEKQLVVTGDPDKVEIESLKRKLRAEKKSVCEITILPSQCLIVTHPYRSKSLE